MKIQCSCGAKFQFDVTPEMVQSPVKFVCPTCGVDSSEFVNNLIRQQFAAAPVAPAPRAVAVATPAVAAPPPRPAVRVHAPSAPAEAVPAEDSAGTPCLKHGGEFAVDKCYVCSKPICPKCMELFGYLCSPLCKSKAEARGIAVPVFEGQKSVIAARFWRKVTAVSAAAGLFVAGLLGLWFWYAWFGSVPKPVFSLQMPHSCSAGRAYFCGKDRLVYLHSGVLAMHDIKKKKVLWSHTLIDMDRAEKEAAEDLKDSDTAFHYTPEQVKDQAVSRASGRFDLLVVGNNIWLLGAGKLTRYDPQTGKPDKELPLPGDEYVQRGEELLFVETSTGAVTAATRVNLSTGETQTDQLGSRGVQSAVAVVGTSGARSVETAGLPVGTPGRDAGKALDPDQVAADYQNMSRPAQIALPALLANAYNQERILQELGDDQDEPSARLPARAAQAAPSEAYSLLPTGNGYIQVSCKLLERRIIEHVAMKPKPTKSVLDGNLNVTQTGDVANEILNEMQRNRGGDIIREDESRYQVKLRTADGSAEWIGEVVGPPLLYPLKTVTVLGANKMVYVLNKDNKVLWQAQLSYNFDSDRPLSIDQNSGEGLGPAVERDGTLYVFDLGVLSAFDLANGNVRWRLPSVGVQGLFFDDDGMMYVNTTTASPEKLKYSRQIDVGDMTLNETLKLDPATGRVVWQKRLGGYISHVTGKFMYTLQAGAGRKEEGPGPMLGLGANPFIRIKRINPKTGEELWEHYQERSPRDVGFDGNRIRVVFGKEIQVLKFLSM